MNYRKGTEGTLNLKNHFLNGKKVKFIKRYDSGVAIQALEFQDKAIT